MKMFPCFGTVWSGRSIFLLGRCFFSKKQDGKYQFHGFNKHFPHSRWVELQTCFQSWIVRLIKMGMKPCWVTCSLLQLSSPPDFPNSSNIHCITHVVVLLSGGAQLVWNFPYKRHGYECWVSIELSSIKLNLKEISSVGSRGRGVRLRKNACLLLGPFWAKNLWLLWVWLASYK